MATALVLGSAACMFEDVQRLEEIIGHEWDGPVVACNDAGWLWPRRLHHWVSGHPELFPAWTERRGNMEGITLWNGDAVADRHEFTSSTGQHTIRRFPMLVYEGSSGMMAAQLALRIADRAVLCGIPLDSQPHAAGSVSQGSDPTTKWSGANCYKTTWTYHVRVMRRHVRSLSGWTRDQFGEPTAEWVADRLRHVD